jgi:hypothetical protein
VSGAFSVPPTLSGITTIWYASLPIASNFSSLYDAVGTCNSLASALVGNGLAYADTTNDRLELKIVWGSDDGAAGIMFTAQYIIK